MSDSVANGVLQECAKLQDQLFEIEKKEKKTYEALAALIQYVQNGKKVDIALKTTDFNQFKKKLIVSVQELYALSNFKSHPQEPKFNVKHYERAILCASDNTYRDMAIQAANKDLNQEAMFELISAIKKNCKALSKQAKEVSIALHKMKAGDNSELWSKLVELRQDEEAVSF